MIKEINELLEDIRKAVGTIKEKLSITYNLVQEILNTEYITDGITITGSRFAIESGGYRVIGKRVYIHMVLVGKVSLAGNDYWTAMGGLPAGTENTAFALAVARYAGTAPMSGYVYNDSLAVVLGNQAISSGAKIIIDGSYIIAGGGVHPNPLKSLFQRRCLLWHCL
ncbi:MAG: hypothetical protein Q4F78_07185 [Bacillota bacterium]|nr:hypothetical protein [Bacillota bacterium]